MGNIFVRDMGSWTERLQKGWIMQGHCHNFDHVTIIVAGRFHCRRWHPVVSADGEQRFDESGQPIVHLGEEVERTAPAMMLIKASHWHSFESLEDGGILMCVYSHRDPQSGDVVQAPSGWRKGYE